MADEETPTEDAPEAAPPPEPKAAKEAAPKAEKAVVAASGAGQVAAAAAGPPAVVVVQPPPAGFTAPEVTRRKVLAIGFWAGLLGVLGGIAVTFLNFFYPRGITGFGTPIAVGTVDQLAPGGFIRSLEAKAWVMRLGAQEAEREGAPEGSIIALYHVCPHLGCTVPWRPDFTLPTGDPRNNGEIYAGWFRCPCHGSTYSFTGVRVFGPAPRSMDVFELTIEDNNIIVNTAVIRKGTTENPSLAIQP